MSTLKRGFTLIELLAVVSIIALLASVLLPSLSSARRMARATVCMSNLRRLGTSAAIYLGDNGGRYFPFRMKRARPDGGTYVNGYGAAKPRWQWFLSGDAGAVIDPEPFAVPFGDGPENGTTRMDSVRFICPSLRGPWARDIRNGAYGYNYQYLGNTRVVDPGDGGAPRFVNFPVSEASIRATSATIVFGDSRGGDVPHGKHSYTLDPPRLAIEFGTTKFGPKVPGDGTIAHAPAEARHRGTAVTAFVDAHAERKTLRGLGYDVGPDGVVVPDFGGGAVATNRLWTGSGRDTMR